MRDGTPVTNNDLLDVVQVRVWGKFGNLDKCSQEVVSLKVASVGDCIFVIQRHCQYKGS